jgi:MoxR-like ATPase
MNIETLKESLPFLIKAEIPALMVGHHGVGKTQGAQQFAAENKYFIRILNLGTQEVGDIIGLADFVKDKDGNNVATKFMIPDWAKELKEFC